MRRKHNRFEWVGETISLYKGSIRFLLGLAVALLSIFLYLSQPAQGAILSRQESKQTQLLETTRDEIARLSIQISEQITLDKVQAYARAKGLRFGDDTLVRFVDLPEGTGQTAVRR